MLQRASAFVSRKSLGVIRRFAALDLSVYDEAQLAMMEEMCIVTDFDDNVVGQDTKKNVHLIDGPCMRAGGLPHRAFSVFLFDQNWNLLLQKRCDEKILFPLHWANTCCSHPLAEGATFIGEPIFGESEGPAGVVRAARRKMHQELGIVPTAVPEDSFRFVTKVHYKAPLPGPEPQWGEHEIDYILLCQRPREEIEATLELNPNEVEDVMWLDYKDCREFVETNSGTSSESTNNELISPWFGAIERELLHPWWEAMRNGVDVEADGQIHRLDGGEEAMLQPTS